MQSTFAHQFPMTLLGRVKEGTHRRVYLTRESGTCPQGNWITAHWAFLDLAGAKISILILEGGIPKCQKRP